MKLNRKLVLVLALLMSVIMGTTGTIAYLQDTEETVNVMTLGNVDIEQLEQEYDENGELQAYTPNKPLYPAYVAANGDITGAIDKIVSVKNVGNSDAYVRTLIAFEAGNLSFADFTKYIHTEFDTSANISPNWLNVPVTVGGVNYYVACMDYDMLTADSEAKYSLKKVYMDKEATNEIVAQFGTTYDIAVISQAVQTTNMPDSAAAWDASFGAFNETNAATWFGGVSIPTTTVATAKELTDALAAGKSVVLTADVELDPDNTINIAAGKNVTLDLGGYTLSGTADGTGNREMFLVKGKMTVKNGTIEMDATQNQGWNAMTTIFDVTAGGVLNLDGVTAKNLGGSDMAFVAHLNNWGEVTLNVNNSTLQSTYIPVRVFNSGYDMNNVTIKNSTLAGKYSFWVHNYVGDSAQGTKEEIDARLNFDLTDASNVFAGKILYGFNSEAYPYENEIPVFNKANTADKLHESANAGGNVVLTEDVKAPLANSAIYGTSVAVIQKGGIIDGNGNSLIIENPKYEGYAIETYGGTIKNLTIDTAVGRGIVISSPTEDTYIDNVVIDGPGYAINTTEHNGKKLYVSNSTVNGWTSLAGLEKVTFTNCSFGENQSKYWQNMGYEQDYDRLFRPYVNAELTSCKFEKGYYLDLSALGASCKVTLDGCTSNGTKITADNYANYITVELPSGRTLADCVIFK